MARGRRQHKTETTVEGLKELKEEIRRIARPLGTYEAARAWLTAARKIRDQARREAPVSRWPIVSRLSADPSRGRFRLDAKRLPPGSLRKAIIHFGSKKYIAELGPAAFVRVNIFRGRDRAPHAHLVEWGTQERRAENGKLMVFPRLSGRGWVGLRSVRRQAPNSFFARALRSAGQSALDAAAREAAKLLEHGTK